MQKYDVEKWLQIRFQKLSRYYYINLKQDLWGNWNVTCQWGGLGSRKGGQMSIICDNYAQALKIFADKAERRRKRRYE